jgi:hypothetical protein
MASPHQPLQPPAHKDSLCCLPEREAVILKKEEEKNVESEE